MDYLFICRWFSHDNNDACICRLEVLKDILDADSVF